MSNTFRTDLQLLLIKHCCFWVYALIGRIVRHAYTQRNLDVLEHVRLLTIVDSGVINDG